MLLSTHIHIHNKFIVPPLSFRTRTYIGTEHFETNDAVRLFVFPSFVSAGLSVFVRKNNIPAVHSVQKELMGNMIALQTVSSKIKINERNQT